MPRLHASLTEQITSPLAAHAPMLRRGAALVLAALMLATRQRHVGLFTDASWAVFFLGGFYLGGAVLFAAFMAMAVTIDYVATAHMGISSYCLSPAYGFLLPSYASLWLGGIWAARHWDRERALASVPMLAVRLLAVNSLCFMISNGSFYWLSARVANPTLAGWAVNLRDRYGYFIAVPAAYVSAAVAAQMLVEHWPVRLAQTLRRS